MNPKENLAVIVHTLAHEIFKEGIAVVQLPSEKRATEVYNYLRKNRVRFDRLAAHLPVTNYVLRKNQPLNHPAIIYAPKDRC